MAKDNNAYGYGEVEEVVKMTSTQSKYLQFRKGDNGRQIQIRIASEPTYIIQHWITGEDGKTRPVNCEGEKCPYCGESVPVDERIEKKSRWAWIVIDRADEKTKIFMGPNSVALRLKDLSQLKSAKTKKPIWGDPRTFDITITYVEKTSGFAEYQIEPDPESREPLTKEELNKVKESNFDLQKELRGSKKSENLGNYKTGDMETVSDNNSSDDIDDEDIPF